jgi:hypothetical protein
MKRKREEKNLLKKDPREQILNDLLGVETLSWMVLELVGFGGILLQRIPLRVAAFAIDNRGHCLVDMENRLIVFDKEKSEMVAEGSLEHCDLAWSCLTLSVNSVYLVARARTYYDLMHVQCWCRKSGKLLYHKVITADGLCGEALLQLAQERGKRELLTKWASPCGLDVRNNSLMLISSSWMILFTMDLELFRRIPLGRSYNGYGNGYLLEYGNSLTFNKILPAWEIQSCERVVFPQTSVFQWITTLYDEPHVLKRKKTNR